MKEIYRSADIVMLSRVESILSDHEIGNVRLDQHTSNLFAGALNMVQQRIMVAEDDHNNAARILRGHQIKPSSDAKGDKVRTNWSP